MKLNALALLCLAPAALPALAISSEQLEFLPGTWSCAASFKEQGIGVAMQTRDTFSLDGRISSQGSVNIIFAGDMEPMAYRTQASGTWRWEDGKLFGTMTGLSLENMTYPELDQVFTPAAMLPPNVSGYFTIIALDAARLHLDSEPTGVTYRCQR